MGDPISKFEKHNCEQSETNPIWYWCDSLPRTHPEVKFYLLKYGPETGVCLAKAVSQDVQTNGYGFSLRSAVDKVKDQLEEKYGSTYEFTDFLMPGSIWDEPKYWMRSLEREERSYMYVWESTPAFPLPDGLHQLALIAAALSADAGYWMTEFYFANDSKCDEIEKKQGSDAF